MKFGVVLLFFVFGDTHGGVSIMKYNECQWRTNFWVLEKSIIFVSIRTLLNKNNDKFEPIFSNFPLIQIAINCSSHHYEYDKNFVELDVNYPSERLYRKYFFKPAINVTILQEFDNVYVKILHPQESPRNWLFPFFSWSLRLSKLLGIT